MLKLQVHCMKCLASKDLYQFGSSVTIVFAVEPHCVLAGQEWNPTCLALCGLGTVSRKLSCHSVLWMMIGAWTRSACDAHPLPPSLVTTSLLYGENLTWTMQATHPIVSRYLFGFHSPCRTSFECSIYIRTKRNGISNDWVVWCTHANAVARSPITPKKNETYVSEHLVGVWFHGDASIQICFHQFPLFWLIIILVVILHDHWSDLRGEGRQCRAVALVSPQLSSTLAQLGVFVTTVDGSEIPNNHRLDV